MEIKIGKIEEMDIKAVRVLALKTPELWDDEQPGYFSEDELKGLLESPDDVYIKATVDGNFAGYIIVTYNKYLKLAYLMDISIKEEYRNLGIANLLFAETEKELKARECTWTWALVHEKNIRMQNIMEKKGFKKGRKWIIFSKEIV